ncbi:hypothetical protein BKA58DRAFT_12050 [Alternaria rosae]|uniref:uncharacterized protein n=1 Tax=Alternaria rosae TaxID=1187941 RepID=UPI001E8DF5C5|nr:uncharacterized protein BKA58DRAFT_12050 [Alternaria rosae]KAH6882022.1 hypothetical protein BKA58DRAFT_12050 [Alternaria rosae]
MSNLNEEYSPEDMALVAADFQKMEDGQLNHALEASRVTAGWRGPRRSTSTRAEVQSEDEDEDEETLVALDVSRVEAEEADRRRNADTEADEQRLLEAQRQSEREALAAHQEREATLVALSISQVEAEEADRQRLLEVKRQSEREALAACQEREATRKAGLQSLKDERARAQAARLRQETLDQAIVESRLAAETEQQRQEQQSARLQETYALSGLSEDEQLQMAMSQSQKEEHSREVAHVAQLRETMLRWVNKNGQTPAPSGEPSATQHPEDRPVLGAIASYPPGPVTEQEQRSMADTQEVINNPNVLYRPLTSISGTSASRPASLRSVADAQARDPNLVTATTSDRSRASIRSVSSGRSPSYHTIEENPALRVESSEVPHDIPNEPQTIEDQPVYPGAYPPSRSQSGSSVRSTVGHSRPIVGTPLLPGAYPPSYASSRAPRSEAGTSCVTPMQGSVIVPQPLGNSLSSITSSIASSQGRNAGSHYSWSANAPVRSEQLSGAWPLSSQASRVPSRLNTVSSGGTFFTAQETQPLQRQTSPPSAISDLWNHRARDSHQHEGPGPRLFTPVSASSRPSETPSAVRPPSSRTSQGSVVRKPVAQSQPSNSATIEQPALATAANTVRSMDVIPSGLERGPPACHFHAPVNFTIYNITEEPKSSQNLLKQLLNKSTHATKGMKVFEQKGAELYLNSVAEATSNLWRNKRNIFPVRSCKSAANAVVNEAREIDRFPVSQTHDDMGSIASPFQARQELQLMNPDPPSSELGTPKTRRPLQSEMPTRQSDELATPRPSTLQRSVTSPPLTATIQSRSMSLDQSTASQISDVNGNAVTPPSVCQSRVRSSMDKDSFRCASELRPQPLDIRKQPPPMPPKPLGLTSSSACAAPSPLLPPPRNRNPMTRRIASEQKEQSGWLQQLVLFPIMNPTQEPTIGSPDSMTVTAPTPRRINVDLNRRSQFEPIDTSLANVPPGERHINEFNSRSMMDIGMMSQLGNPAIMDPLLGQYEQTYTRPPHVQQERLNSDARAKKKEKDIQKALRKQC